VLRIVAYIRPHKLEEVKTALAQLGLTGITVSEARGCGSGPEPSDWMLGKEYVVALPPRIKLETIVSDEVADAAVAAIVESARTGKPGDGKVFVLRESDAVRVRTGERGEAAL
jgi:nitrogen regulatory protein P-II 1